MLQEMKCFILFALFTNLDCLSANNQCFGANSMGDDCRVIEFKEGTKNKILKNYVIRTQQVQDKDICELRCYLEPHCVSYNYGPRGGGTFTCELNNMTHLQVLDSFEDKNGFLYTEIFNPCESNPCANHATCQAGFGDHGYRCLCPAGYQGVQCETDIDECKDDSHECHFAADCANIAGSFDCSCKSGHLGDGRHFCSDNWKKINIGPVCFGTKHDDYGSFEIREAGKIFTFELVHTSGSVTCNRNFIRTKWGCSSQFYGNHNLMTVITYSNKSVLPLAKFVKSNEEYFYQLSGADVNSPTLVFNLLPTPLVVSVGQQFQVWYGQDLADFTENNNDGKTCTDVHALYPLN
ncbi:protein jagged-1-like [Stylophora pistillata]|uniref:protein jagged-1-like n=1 Tax=Stylophora pistillata TaxID=50429 RepID=UPI000C04D82E|nr:protein jagged-1-like [Stylophora pistillata]